MKQILIFILNEYIYKKYLSVELVRSIRTMEA